MDDITQYKQNAVKAIHQANFLFSTTYKMIKEPKALLSISSHVLTSFMNSVSAILAFEGVILADDEAKLQYFKKESVKKYGLQEYDTLIERISFLLQEHKKSVVEFTRGSSYVMCSDQFSKVDKISESDVQNYIKKAKEFVSVVERIAA